jgi:hypothetical protein
MTLKRWTELGGCGLSSYTAWELCYAYGGQHSLASLESRPLAELSAACPMLSRELGRFRATHADQLRGEALTEVGAEVDPKHPRCFRLTFSGGRV